MAQTKTKNTTKKATNSKILNIVFLWDKSGSMSWLRQSAIEGATSYITDLVKDKNAKNMRMSIITFDTEFKRIFSDQPVGEIPVDSLAAMYRPDGWTALNDAVADAISLMDKRLETNPGEKVLIVVLTDGQENSSKEYGGFAGTKALAELIKLREDDGGWTFIYLGTGRPGEVGAIADRYNIPRGNTMSYVATQDGMKGASSGISYVTRRVAASPMGATNTAFADAGLDSVEEQEDQ